MAEGRVGEDEPGNADRSGVPHAVDHFLLPSNSRAGESRATQPGGHQQSGSTGSVREAPVAFGAAGSPARERDFAVAGHHLHHRRSGVRQVVAGRIFRDEGGFWRGDATKGQDRLGVPGSRLGGEAAGERVNTRFSCSFTFTFTFTKRGLRGWAAMQSEEFPILLLEGVGRRSDQQARKYAL